MRSVAASRNLGSLVSKVKSGLSALARSSGDSYEPEEESTNEIVIGTPVNIHHEMHIGYNPVTRRCEGLPPEWSALLAGSGITSEEAEADPDTVLEVLQFQQRLADEK